VAQVFQLHRTVTRHGTTRHEVVSGLTSLPPVAAGADRFLDLTRQDWSSENRVHWRRDVTWQEDACQGRAGPAALVFAILNTAVLALLDRLGTASLPATMRAVMANPTPALALLLSNPNF